MKGSKKNKLYYLLGNTVTTQDYTLLTTNEDVFSLWHKTMGHIGNKDVKSLTNQKLLGKD